MNKIVVLSGAGISAESGLKTFRDEGGLWEGYNVYEVATPEAWKRNPELVLDFYNMRRKEIRNAKPNTAHKALVDLEEKFDVTIVTQNIDDLHERAGSTRVLHLHGQINQARSTFDHQVYDLSGTNLNLGMNCPKGYQLRPHIVWFGEPVPVIEEAIPYFRNADIVIVTGTSLAVYPAAGLINQASPSSKKYLIDPNPPSAMPDFEVISSKASIGLPALVNKLLQ